MKKFCISFVTFCLLFSTSCTKPKNKKQVEITTPLTESTIKTTQETTIQDNPYYRFPVYDWSAEEIANKMISLSVITTTSYQEYKSQIKIQPVTTSYENGGYCYKFIDDYNYSYSDQKFVDNIQSIQLNFLEVNGQFSIGAEATVKIICVVRDESKANEIYTRVADYITSIINVETDKRDGEFWSMFASRGNNFFNAILKMKDRNSGFWIIEAEIPVINSAI